MNVRTLSVATILALAGVSGAGAQDGTPDPAFGNAGARRVAFDRPNTDGFDVPAAVAVQPDGKLLVVGTAPETGDGLNAAVVRLEPDGATDPTFGAGPFTFGAATNEGATDVLVEPSGSVLFAVARQQAGLTFDYVVYRWSSLGVFEASIGIGLTSQSPQVRLAFDPVSGRPLVAMSFTSGSNDAIRVVRLLSNLTLDFSYGIGQCDIQAPGGHPTYLADIEALPDGRLVVAGSASVPVGGTDLLAARVTQGGVLDASFGSGGISVVPIDLVDFETDRAVALAVDAGGRPLIAGSAYDDSFDDLAAVLVRLTATGGLDPSFNGGAPLVVADTNGDDAMNGVVVQSDGRIVVAGKVRGAASPMFFAARYLEDGSADWSFGSFGAYFDNFPGSPGDDYAVALALQGGRPILVGPAEWSAPDYDFGVLRLRSALVFADGFERGSAAGWSAAAP